MKRKEFERVTPETVGVPSTAIERLLDKLESGFTEPHGLMIMRYGKVCAEGWWTPFAPGIRHGQQSHTKTYAATAVGIACTEGILELDERLIDIFPDEAPENPSENLKKLRVRDVLCMGCGMEEMPKPGKDWIRDFLHTPVVHEPGTTYMYNSVGSTMLGAIVRKRTGLGLHDYLKSRLFDKIGIDADNLRWTCMPDGMEVGGGGLFCTTEDNLRLMKLYADGGVWEGERILSEEYVKLATTLQNESATEEAVNPAAKDNFVGYGYQIWMCRPKGVYRADGAMGQFTIVVPDKSMIISITENASGAHWAQQTLDVMWEFLEEIPDAESLPENPELSGRLRNRMKRLCLPAPGFASASTESAKWENKIYRITEGKLQFAYVGGIMRMGGEKDPDPAGALKFAFGSDRTVLSYEQNGEWKKIVIAMDGSRAQNNIGEGPVTQALVSGLWEKEERLEVTVRWIETCHTNRYVFFFEEDEVKILFQNHGMFEQTDEWIKGVAE